jgi:hypothetical protein
VLLGWLRGRPSLGQKQMGQKRLGPQVLKIYQLQLQHFWNKRPNPRTDRRWRLWTKQYGQANEQQNS